MNTLSEQKRVDWKEWGEGAVGLALPVLIIAPIYYLLSLCLTGFFPLWVALLIAVPLGIVVPLILMILWGAGGLMNAKVVAFVILAVTLIVWPVLWRAKRPILPKTATTTVSARQ